MEAKVRLQKPPYCLALQLESCRGNQTEPFGHRYCCRASTLALGQRLRGLYVDQLGFMPAVLQDANHMYLRATPIPRALESVQQTFYGLYPPSSRAAGFVPPTIIQRQPSHETLFPNEGACRRFAQLSQAFAQRTSDRWNDSPDMAYLNKMFGKWMPEDSPTVKVDSHPRLRFVGKTACI